MGVICAWYTITNTQTQFAFAMSDEGPIEESILHAARRVGYHDLREQQLHAAKKFLQGKDVFVSLPTGSGKSFISAVLPFAFDHLHGSEGTIVVVVSPLLSPQSQLGREYIAF